MRTNVVGARGRRAGVGVLLSAGLLLVAGCGGPCTVSGTVTYRSQPVPGGQINFIGADGKSASGTLNGDGTYTVVNVPAGEVTVTITAIRAEGDQIPGAKVSLALPKTPPKIRSVVPPRYGDPSTSGLKYNIDSRQKSLDINLTD